MTFSTRQYFRNWGLYVRGVRWLWTRDISRWHVLPAASVQASRDGIHYVRLYAPHRGYLDIGRTSDELIDYKDRWGPWKFLLGPYLTTYLASVCLGLGVVSLSRWWYERSVTFQCGCVKEHKGTVVTHTDHRPYKFSRFMTRLLDWAFPGSAHGRHTGPILWGSRSAWE